MKMTTRRVQDMKERIAENQSKHKEAMEVERDKRYEERRNFEKKIIATERRQSHALSMAEARRKRRTYNKNLL